MTSVYKTDFGNGVVVYADDYVKTGKWVFDCGYSRLISRERLSAPISELKEAGRLAIGYMYALSDADEAQAKEVIRAVTRIDGWYEKLGYLYSGLNGSGDINTHVFDLLARHDGRMWALRVRQWIERKNTSSFQVTAQPYDPETYMNHARMLQTAAQSCPVAQ